MGSATAVRRVVAFASPNRRGLVTWPAIVVVPRPSGTGGARHDQAVFALLRLPRGDVSRGRR
jgi:hypothetical protein